MGSTSTAAMLFYCVALSMVAIGFAVPEENPKFISMDALFECSNNITETAPRKLVAVQGDGNAGAVGCPVRFDRERGVGRVIRNCRGMPSAERCCGAFKNLACPYSDLINDNSENGCASAMFWEITVRGRLRPGLFSQLCAEGSFGMQCP
ncbi:hypothetical protein BAE44_0009879 [Dichanthelium oligosanthes]|uniref:GPI-anchored protein LLG1-like domain-containing protein n=1 Tax=Dichanthelium oligosanthes TaxID=888268 RepID=A0A1E5VVI3_9POAL|nr:hypothetical protein BAE44_0009879 [Dichanthelium oligosanthes]